MFYIYANDTPCLNGDVCFEIDGKEYLLTEANSRLRLCKDGNGRCCLRPGEKELVFLEHRVGTVGKDYIEGLQRRGVLFTSKAKVADALEAKAVDPAVERVRAKYVYAPEVEWYPEHGRYFWVSCDVTLKISCCVPVEYIGHRSDPGAYDATGTSVYTWRG